MSNAAKRERVEQMLGELAELSLMLARDLAVQARGAEDPETKAALADAFQQTARTTRLTLALDAKLDRDAARDAREAGREAAKDAADAQLRESRIMQAAEAAAVSLTAPSPQENQKRRVKAVLNRLIWNEAEGDSEEYDILLEDLDHRLWEIEDAPGFAEAPIEVLARTLANDMRLSGELVITTAGSFAYLPRGAAGGGDERRIAESNPYGNDAARRFPRGTPRPAGEAGVAEERMVEGASPANTPPPPLADTG